jgi:hypothetical protein
VVKHFKWVPRGKRRIHSKPSSLEIKACLPWLERMRGQGWSEAYVFFKHEDDGTAPAFARRLLEAAGAQSAPA